MTPILAPVIVTLVVILTLLLLLLMGYLLWVQHQAGAESERRREVQRKLKQDRPTRARAPRTTQAAIRTMGPSRIPVDAADISRNCFKA